MKSKIEQQKFQSYQEKTENGQRQVQKLDKETERRITAFQDAALDYQHARDHGKEAVWSNVTKAEAALRSRVRELIEEARKEGAPQLTPDGMIAWTKGYDEGFAAGLNWSGE